MNTSTTTLTFPAPLPSHRQPRWAALLTTIVAACAIWFLRPHLAGAAPGPSLAAAVATDDDAGERVQRSGKKSVTGKLNLNTATVDQLMMLPGIGPAKADLIVAFRGKHGPFKRVADLRKVKGFGYKTLKKLEPFLDVKGETTLAGS